MTAAEIYPVVWAGSVPDDLLARFTVLCRFYEAAADNDQAALLTIC